MAKATDEAIAAVDMTQIAQIIGAAVAQGVSALAPKPQIVEGSPEYTARLKDEGLYDEFEVEVYQNGYQAQARGLSEQTRHRASHLTQGRYIKTAKDPQGRVRVDVDAKGHVFINYPTKGDGMLLNTSYWRDFPDLIDKLWAEMHPTA